VTGLPDTVTPAQQPSFDVQLNSAYSLPITGTVTLTFTPDAVARPTTRRFSSLRVAGA